MSYRPLLVLALAVLMLSSCAHRSGHNRRPRSASGVTSRQAAASENQEAGEKNFNPPPTKHEGQKLEGPEIFSRYSRAVFTVFTSDGKMEYQGSGFFVNNHGLAVSNYHVFEPSRAGVIAIKLLGSNQVYRVTRIMHADEQHDFVVFQVGIDQTVAIPLAQARPAVGEQVYAIGSPRGLENTFTSGEISAWRDRYLIQTSVKIDHGNSGGALINAWGEAVGITSGSFYEGSQADLNYAWSIEAVKPYITD